MSHLNMCNLTTSFYPFLQAAINAVHPLLSLVLKSMTMVNQLLASLAMLSNETILGDF